MKRALTVQTEYEQIGTIGNLASVFEAIASLHISQIKDQVVTSTNFFNDLWHIYSQLRVTKNEYVRASKPEITERPALAVITSEGGLIGDIDERIVTTMAEEYKRGEADLYVIGAHGASLVNEKGLKPLKVFGMPSVERGSSIDPIVAEFRRYERAVVYYQTYVSLTRQETGRIELFSAVANLSRQSAEASEVISTRDYIFEPSIGEIAKYLESIMLQIALGQVLLESRLAQYASRFNTMFAAKTRAKEMQRELKLTLNRAHRGEGDERLKEMFGAIKLMERQDG